MLSEKADFVNNDFFLFAKDTEQAASAHFHKHAELIFSGVTHLDIYIPGHDVRHLQPNEILIIPPEQIHAVVNASPEQPYQLLHINLDKLFLLFSPCPYADFISLLFSEAISSVIYRGSVVTEITNIFNNIKNKFEIKYISDLINIINLINKNTPEGIISNDNSPRQLKFYSTLNELVESGLMECFHLDHLSKKFFMSKSTFQRQVKKCTGLSFHAWLQRCKMQRALIDLRKNLPVSEIASNLGFSSPSHFCKTFKTYYGVSPRKSRNGDQPLEFIK